MLMNLLPGLRELRTPLACGYMWLLSIWIAWHEKIPTRAEATGVMRSLYELSSTLGKPAVLAALSFTAFMIGSLLEIRSATLFPIISRLLNLIIRSFAALTPFLNLQTSPTTNAMNISGSTFRSLMTLIERVEGWNARTEVRPTILSPVSAIDTARQIIQERPQLATKLQIESPELYSEFDRRAAEADFRLNTGVALTGLCLAVANDGAPFAISGILLAIFLSGRSVTSLRASYDVLIQALIAGKTTSNALDRHGQRISVLYELEKNSQRNSADPMTATTISDP
ncbi:hypothetical protein ABZ835_12740 [Streptomyces sp. NPDC047461]|uniref:hypothetical protein n=1 Tax=Streptomyces sp. NPDC047461 TaxID=3155619 RepID=UPI003401EF98